MCAARIKQSISDLAILGGQPLFDEPLHVGRPNILDAEDLYTRIHGIIERRWLSNDGPLVHELEASFCKFLGVKHCIAVANATLGLQFVVQALGVKGKVIMPSFTFIATPHAVTWQGATPVFCDVIEETHTLDPQKVREAMSPDVGAIIGVHVWGRACEIDELQAIADEWNVPLIFDAAHALGSSYKGQRLGRFGKAEVFSLHATKAINGVEAGFIATDDDELAEKLRAVRNYGFTDQGIVGGLGINGKMHEISAAMALSNMPYYERLAAHNGRLHDAYERAFAGVPAIRVHSQQISASNDHYAVFFLGPEAGLERDRLLNVLDAENVRARRYFWPGCHRSPPYSTASQPSLPVTERLISGIFQLPTGLQLQEAEAAAIGKAIALAVKNGKVVSGLVRDPA
jgi:dTDP-4-amino-4,6-dideoxygalactose transaminase